MKKRVVDYIKLKNQLDLTINNSALDGLRRQNRILRNITKLSLIFGIGSFVILAKLNEIEYILTMGKKKRLNAIK